MHLLLLMRVPRGLPAGRPCGGPLTPAAPSLEGSLSEPTGRGRRGSASSWREVEMLSPPSEIDEGEENGGEDDGVPQNGLDAHLRRLLQGRRQRTLLVGGEGFAEPVEDN